MSPEAKRRVVQRVTKSGALPVSRDAPGYSAVLKLLGVTDSSLDRGEQGANSNGNIGRAGEASIVQSEIAVECEQLFVLTMGSVAKKQS